MADGDPAPEGKILLRDGVGTLRRGDVQVMVYQSAARLERTRWLFDIIDLSAERVEGGLLGLLIVLPSADPPDSATHRENFARLRALGPRVRRLVTVPIGTAFRTSMVRAVMHGLNVILGHSGTRFVADSLDTGLARLLEARSPKTPSPTQLIADTRALYLALGEPDPHFEASSVFSAGW
jgi:hypothetical protein